MQVVTYPPPREEMGGTETPHRIFLIGREMGEMILVIVRQTAEEIQKETGAEIETRGTGADAAMTAEIVT